MHPGLTSTPGRPQSRRALVLPVVVAGALVVAACSGGSSKSSSARRRAATTTSSTPQVLGTNVVNAADTSGTATRFTLTDGTVVLVPVGAVAAGAEVRVAIGAVDGLSRGAIEGGTSAYDVSVTSGAISKPVAIQLALPDAPDRAGATAVWWDAATSTWQPVNADSAPGTLTIYASKPGRYAWVRWSWAAAATVGAQTVRAVVGPSDPGDAELACGSAADLAPRFRPRSTGAALQWCAGVSSGADRLAVANRSEVPVALRQRGLENPTVTRRDALSGPLADLVRKYTPPTAGVAFDVLAPGDRVAYNLVVDVDASAAVAADARAHAYQSLAAAVAFTAGLYAGSVDAAVAVMQGDEATRTALLAAIDQRDCASAVVAGGDTDRSAAEWAQAAQRLVTACVPADVARQLVAAASKRSALRAAFATVTGAVPVASQPLLAPALVEALTPLVDTSAAGSVTLTPVPPEPTTTTGAPGAPDSTTPTVPTGPTTSTTLVVGPTTVVTAPPVGGTTTVVASATTTTAAPSGALLSIVGPTTCSDRGGVAGSIALLGAGFTGRGGYTLTYTNPSGGRRNVGGTATAAGAFAATFSCNNQARGDWTVVARDNTSGRVSPALTFTVARI